MVRSACLLVLASSLALGSAACAPSARPHPLPPAQPPRVALPPPPAPSVPPGHLARAEVDPILIQGAPWLLRQVMAKEVLARDSSFIGWRMIGLPEDWSSIDVRPGDIVSRVNGLPIMNAEELFAAWTSIGRTTEIRIDLTRDGAPKQVIIPIDGPLSPETAKALAHQSGPPHGGGEAAQPARRSIQLGGASAEPTEDDAL
jgi:hypothetical protein